MPETREMKYTRMDPVQVLPPAEIQLDTFELVFYERGRSKG
jgi:hypothetical protein